MSFCVEALCSRVEAFCRSAFSCSIAAGMVAISCFTRGMPRCSMLVRVASEEMISTPAGQELGYGSLVVVPMKVCVDDEPERLGRELFDLLDEGTSSGRLGVGVDNEDDVVEQDDR